MTPGAERCSRASYDALGLSAAPTTAFCGWPARWPTWPAKSLLDEDSLLEALQYRAQEKVEL